MKYFIRINAVIVLIFLLSSFYYHEKWLFLFMAFDFITPATKILDSLSFYDYNCGELICIPQTAICLTIVFVCLLYLLLSYFNSRSSDQNKSSKIVLVLSAILFMFNIGSSVPIYESLMQKYHNRLSSFDQNITQKYDYSGFFSFLLYTSPEWVDVGNNPTKYIALVPERIADKKNSLVVSPAGTIPSFINDIVNSVIVGANPYGCNNAHQSSKKIVFAGRSASECVFEGTSHSMRIIRITDVSGLYGWTKDNFIYYNLAEPYQGLVPLYDKILSTFTFTAV